jgi:hypothetical protein
MLTYSLPDFKSVLNGKIWMEVVSWEVGGGLAPDGDLF